MDLASDPILVVDKGGKILNVNKIALKLIGYQKKELVNKFIMAVKILPPASKIIVLKNFAKRMLGRQIKPYNVDLIAKNGKVLKVEINASPIRNRNKIVGDFITVRDITARAKQEDKLRQSKELMEKVFLSIDSAIFILDGKDTPHILKCNRNAIEMFDYKEKEMIGKTTQFLHVDRKHLRNFEKALYPTINAKKQFCGFEFEMKRKNGEVFPAVISVFPLTSNNRRTGWVSVIGDISQRKKFEKTLMENEKKFRDFLDNSIDLIQMVNVKGRFVYVNKKWCQTLNYNKEDASGMKFSEVVKKDEIKHNLEIFKKTLKGESVNNIETSFISKKGKEIEVMGSVNSIMKDNKFESTLGIFQDISKIKKREEFKEEYINEVEKVNRLLVGRELKMIELKEKIKSLENRLANSGSNNA